MSEVIAPAKILPTAPEVIPALWNTMKRLDCSPLRYQLETINITAGCKVNRQYSHCRLEPFPTTYTEAGFSNTKQEPKTDKLLPGFYASYGSANSPPEEHNSWDEQGWSGPRKDHIARYLSNDVSDLKEDNAEVVSAVCKVSIISHSCDSSISKVRSILQAFQ